MTVENDRDAREAHMYRMVVGALMVGLMAFGLLNLIGVIKV
jgi:hypothetical protein